MKAILFHFLFVIVLQGAAFGQGWYSYFGGSGNEAGYDVIQTSDGGFLAVGYSNSFIHGQSDVFVVKTDSLGKLIWQNAFGGFAGEIALESAENSAGDFFIAGEKQTSSDKDIYLIKLNNQGELLWEKNIDNGGNESTTRILSEGLNVVISGYVNSVSQQDAFLLKLDSAGTELWWKFYGGPNSEKVFGLAQVHDGGYLMCGSYDATVNSSAYVVRTDAFGDTLWTRFIPIGGTGYNSYISCTELVGDSTFVMVGEGGSFYGTYYATRLDLNGDLINHYTYSGYLRWAGNVEPTPDGGFVVSGYPFIKFDYKAAVEWETGMITGFGLYLPEDGSYVTVSSEYGSTYPLNYDLKLMKTNVTGISIPNSQIEIQVTPAPTFCNVPDSVILSILDGFDSYQWIHEISDYTSIAIPNSNFDSIYVKEPGLYYCVMTLGSETLRSVTRYINVGSSLVFPQLNHEGTISYCYTDSVVYLTDTLITPTATYQWYHNGNIINGATGKTFYPVNPGNYSLAKSTSCGTYFSDTVEIASFTPPVIQFTSTGDSVDFYPEWNTYCDSVLLSVLHRTGYTYQWFLNGNPLPDIQSFHYAKIPGDYYVNVSNFCGSSSSQVIHVYSRVISFSMAITGPITGCGSESTTFSITGVPNFGYNWYKNGILQSTSNVFNPGTAGNYYCRISFYCGNSLFTYVSDTIIYSYIRYTRKNISFQGLVPTICSNDSIRLTISPYSNATYQWYVDSVPIPGADSIVYFAHNTGWYQCEAYLPGCTPIISHPFFIRGGLPQASISSTSTQLCPNSSLGLYLHTSDFINGIYGTAQWSRDSIAIVGATSSYFNATQPGVYDCLVANLCGATNSNQITVNAPLPLLTISSNINGNYFCMGDTVTLSVSYSPAITYSWYKGNQLIPGADSNVYLANTPGSYNVRYNDGVCQRTTLNFVLYATSDIGANIINFTTPHICNTGSVLLSANYRDDFTYQWYKNNLLEVGATQQQYLAQTSGEYKVAIYDSLNCHQFSQVKNVFGDEIGNFSIQTNSESNVICNGDSISMYAGISATSYQWYFNNAIIPGATDSIYKTNARGFYSVKVTNAGGCDGSAQISLVEINFTANSSVVVPDFCSNNVGSITINPYNNSNVNYLWYNGSTSNSLTGLSSGNYTVTVTNLYGCILTDTINVPSDDSLNINITGNVNLCPSQSTVLNAGSGFSSYLWSTGAVNQTINVNTPGIYTVTVTNAQGCVGTDTVSVAVNTAPVVSVQLSPVAPYCTGDVVTLTATPGFQIYQWSNGSPSSSITVATSGTYTVSVTNSFGCKTTIPTNITFGNLPPSNISTSIPGPYCEGDSVVLVAPANQAGYIWNDASVLDHLIVDTNGTYSVVVTGANGCTKSGSLDVIFNPSPLIVFQPAGPLSICSGNNITISVPPGFANYNWNTGSTVNTIQTDSSGSYSVTITDVNGCINSDSISVGVFQSPVVNIAAIGSTSFCLGDSVKLEATPGYVSYLWYRQSVPILPLAALSEYYGKHRGNYSCLVTDVNGCTNFSNTISIAVPCIPIEPALDKTGAGNFEELLVYPNPSNEIFNVISNFPLQNLSEASVFDLTGREVKCNLEWINEFEFVISGLKPGVYILKIMEQKVRLVKIE